LFCQTGGNLVGICGKFRDIFDGLRSRLLGGCPKGTSLAKSWTWLKRSLIGPKFDTNPVWGDFNTIFSWM